MEFIEELVIQSDEEYLEGAQAMVNICLRRGDTESAAWWQAEANKIEAQLLRDREYNQSLLQGE